MQDRKNRVAIVEICLFVFMKGRKKYIILKEGRADVTEGEVCVTTIKEVVGEKRIVYVKLPKGYKDVKYCVDEKENTIYINSHYKARRRQ